MENTGRPCLCSSQTVQLNTERTGTALEIEKGWGGGEKWSLFWKASESPLAATELMQQGRSRQWRPRDGEAVLRAHKGGAGEGQLFWLTAYLQLGN